MNFNNYNHSNYNPMLTGRIARDAIRARLADKEAQVASCSSTPIVETLAPNPFEGFNFANTYDDVWNAPQPDQATTVEYAFCMATVPTVEKRVLS